MLSSKEIYNKNARGLSLKGVVNKQQNSSDARTTLADAYTYNFTRSRGLPVQNLSVTYSLSSLLLFSLKASDETKITHLFKRSTVDITRL